MILCTQGKENFLNQSILKRKTFLCINLYRGCTIFLYTCNPQPQPSLSQLILIFVIKKKMFTYMFQLQKSVFFIYKSIHTL